MTPDKAMTLPIDQIALEHYLPAKRKRRQPNTVYGYESSINLHVIPRWGGMTVPEITHDAVQDWVDETAKTSGPGGAEKAYKCLRQVIRWAMDKWGLYVADPTRGVEMPRKPEYRPPVLTQRRLKRLIRGLVGCPHEATAIIQCALGCRPSENYALGWEQINWRNGDLHIGASLHELPGNLYEAPTKTVKGDRDASLPAWALNRLHDIWVALGRPKGRIIGNAKPSKVRRVIVRWAKAHRLPWVGMKNLRHTWGTIAARNNPIADVSAMMGHSDIQITYRYYYRLMPSAIRRAQRKVARSILGKTCDDMYKGIIIPLPLQELSMAA